MRDDVYQNEKHQIVDFAFNEEVVRVFPDMIRRSVPGYETVIPMTGLMAARHAGKHGRVYDLGCSLGATTLAVLAQTDAAELRVIGIDNSNAMVEQARAHVTDPRASFVCADILDLALEKADVIVCNFVMQFLPPGQRRGLLDRCAEARTPGGAIRLSEKVRHDDARLHQFFDETHLAWKRANGYSELEISQKRTALENVMRIDTEATHLERLAQAGFSQPTQWYRCLNWASFVATA